MRRRNYFRGPHQIKNTVGTVPVPPRTLICTEKRQLFTLSPCYFLKKNSQQPDLICALAATFYLPRYVYVFRVDIYKKIVLLKNRGKKERKKRE
jgi:hypothetical protein